MKLYHASVYISHYHLNARIQRLADDREKAARLGCDHILESYHYINKGGFVRNIRRDGIRVFLDSGAFSAYTQGAKVNIDSYCRFIDRNRDIIVNDDGALCASVLDDITDPFKTYQNQTVMEQKGVRPLPCFHYGEDTRYLEHYIANYDYITLGGMVPISTNDLYKWLDDLWDKHLTDGAGRPRVRVHGFGLTTVRLMERYPWYSADSSTWQKTGSNGKLLVPRWGIVNVSNHPTQLKRFDLNHIAHMPEEARGSVLAEIAETGFDIKRLENSYASRWAFNLWAFNYIADRITNEQENRYVKEQQTFF